MEICFDITRITNTIPWNIRWWWWVVSSLKTFFKGPRNIVWFVAHCLRDMVTSILSTEYNSLPMLHWEHLTELTDDKLVLVSSQCHSKRTDALSAQVHLFAKWRWYTQIAVTTETPG